MSDTESQAFLRAVQLRLTDDIVSPDCPLRREMIGVVGVPAITRNFITAISDDRVMSRPESIYGALTVGANRAVLQLYGTGPRQHVDALREIAQKRVLGFIVLADFENAASVRVAQAQRVALQQFAPDKPRLFALLNARSADDLPDTGGDPGFAVMAADGAALGGILWQMVEMLLEA